MTTLDDAAERLATLRIVALANEIDQIARQRHTMSDYEHILRKLWTEATEAAAKKCDAERAKYPYPSHMGAAAALCAAAIRGKP